MKGGEQHQQKNSGSGTESKLQEEFDRSASVVQMKTENIGGEVILYIIHYKSQVHL